MIMRAAIRAHGLVFSLPQPARHGTVLHKFKLGDVPHEQGFLTDTERFVDREEACLHAVAAGQITMPKRTNPQDELFSEDLW